ncbi:TPA: hypothetical protein ACGO63_000479, partial [Streptococcus suis]
ARIKLSLKVLIQTQAIASFPFYCFCFVIDDLSLDKSPCTFGSSSLIFKGLVVVASLRQLS